MLKRATELQGRTMTDFVVTAVQDAAQRAIEQAEVIRLPMADQYCSAAHVALTLADGPWPISDPADDKVNAAKFSGFDISLDLPACGAGFHPYAAADAWQGAAFATERILAVLDGQCTEAIVWSWVRTKAFYDALPVPGQNP
jgi:hypothetical protein